MIKITKVTIFAIAFFAIFDFGVTNSDYNELAFSGDGIDVIENIQDDIIDLEKIQAELNEEFKKLNSDYQLRKILRQNLSIAELNRVKKIVFDYNYNKALIDQTLYAKAKEMLSVIEEKKQILGEKKRLYLGLIPYIDGVYSSQYLEYIRGDLEAYSQQSNTENIITLESRIQEHRDFINESLKKIIESRLDEKINSLKDNSTFKMLPSTSKIKVIDKTIVKIKIKLKNLENSFDNNNGTLVGGVSHDVIDKKIQTYNIAVEKLETFRNSIK